MDWPLSRSEKQLRLVNAARVAIRRILDCTRVCNEVLKPVLLEHSALIAQLASIQHARITCLDREQSCRCELF